MSTETLELPKKELVKKSLTIPGKIILKPVAGKNFRLGLENTKEKYTRIPGVNYRWAPDKTGDTYHTGLHYISQAKVRELEKAIGRKLNNEFYAELSYSMDGSNPNGHHMDLTDPYSLVIYLAFVDSRLIAASQNQIRKGVKPFAEWYIENDEEEAQEKEEQRSEFQSIIEIYNALSPSRRASYCKLLGINVYGVSNKIASNKLWDLIMETGPKSKAVHKKFLAIHKWGDEKIAVSEEVADAIIRNVIRKNAAQDYVYGTEIIGTTQEQIVSKLLLGENSQLRISIKNALEIGQ